MSTLLINVQIPSLGALTPLSGNTYRFVVKFKNNLNQPLNNSNIPNVSTVDVTTTSNTFSIPVTIVTGDYTINDVNVEIYSNNDANCCFASEEITIINDGSDPIENSNVGVLTTQIGNKSYGIINPRNAKAQVLPSGAIRLIYDEISTSETNKQVKCWLLDSQLCEVYAGDVTQLRSTSGLNLPDGNYAFYFYYAATDIANTFEQLRANIYVLFLDRNTWRSNSKELEMLLIEIKSNVLI